MTLSAHAPASRAHSLTTLTTSAAIAVSAVLLPVLTTTPSRATAADPTPYVAPYSVTPTLSRATFADPPTAVRPMYRFWMPLAYTDDDELRSELQQIAAAGGGGVEVSPFIVPGAGNQANAFLAQYGWGTPAWEHKIDVITGEAADLGLVVDQNLGPAYPPTVPTLDSFNQPQAAQQLIYGTEVDAPGTSRSGALPAPITAPPSVATTLCAPAIIGDAALGVTSLGGFAIGDTITLGSGTGAEKVTVTSLGDRSATCGTLSVSPITTAHTLGEAVTDTARATRIKTLVAQCATACQVGTGPITLVPDSVTDVTGQVTGNTLSYSFPAGNGHPWVVIDFLQTAAGLIAQKGGYTETQPNYVVDHWNQGGVHIQTNFWDENILTAQVQANLDKIGGGAIFEDSQELGSTEKWTWGLLDKFSKLRGYDPTTLLPALAGIGPQGTGTPAFDLGAAGEQVDRDYRQTLSDLYASQYVAPMQRWARSHGLQFRVQSYGTPIAPGVAAAAAGVPEGESLNFGAPNPFGAEQDYRAVAGGAHQSGANIVSTECCATFMGNFRSSVAGPNVGGQYGDGGDGTQNGGKYSQGTLDTIYQAYAGGVNQVVLHGFPYRDAPVGVGTAGRDGGTWPGYHPWDIFGALNVGDEFGPREASWADYRTINDQLSRTQLVLRQGKPIVDLGVYYEDLGLAGSSVSPQETAAHMLGNSSATSGAGYTYDYLSPSLLGSQATASAGGGLTAGAISYRALILNNQTTMSLADAQRLDDLARQGLRIFVVGSSPTSTPGWEAGAGALPSIVADLLSQRNVVHIASEAALPAALATAGIQPAAAPERPSSALGLVRRQDGATTYEFAYNRSASVLDEDITLAGSGTPYTLNTWTGQIEPIGMYRAGQSSVTLHVRIAPYDKVIVMLSSAFPAPAPQVHALSSTAGVLATPAGLTARVEHDGTVTTQLSNGLTDLSTVTGIAPSQPLTAWKLNAQTWTPGANAYTTIKTDQPTLTLAPNQDGTLPSWRDITGPVDLSTSSGIGTYTTNIDLPASWTGADGAYLALGKVLDTASVTVNGTPVIVDQSDRDRIDLGTTLHAGTNTIIVRVATTMFNAVRSTGDSNYQMPAWQRTGLMGPITLTPYRDVLLSTSIGGSTHPVLQPSHTRLKISPMHVRAGRRATVVITVTGAAPAQGRVVLMVDGRVRRTVALDHGTARIKAPALRVGRHRIRAVYDGSAQLAPSASPVIRLTVMPRP